MTKGAPRRDGSVRSTINPQPSTAPQGPYGSWIVTIAVLQVTFTDRSTAIVTVQLP